MRLPRFYPILDVASARRRELEITAVARQILEAGATILQVRHKDRFTQEIFADLERIAGLCRQAGAMLVVNDRADVARMLSCPQLPDARGSEVRIQSGDREEAMAASPNRRGEVDPRGFNVGVHLGQDDLAPSDARRVAGSDAIIGFSTHNERQLRDAESCVESQPADYLAFGPIFGTRSKENPDPVVGLDELRRLRPLTSRPLVAIGGITRANARSVIDAGADSVAVIGDLFPSDLSPGGSIHARVAEWLAILSP